MIAGGELTIHVTVPETPVIPEPCIRCAWCIEACPTLIHPALILDAVQRRDMKMAERAGHRRVHRMRDLCACVPVAVAAVEGDKGSAEY